MSTVANYENTCRELAAAARGDLDRHQTIPGFRYPPGIRIAVNFTLDFDAMLARRLSDEPPLQVAKGEFGGRVGIWRLLEMFEGQGVETTVFTPGRICELYPLALERAARAGHEIADHMWEHHVPSDPAREEDHLLKTIAALERIVGRRPVGTRSPHRASLLRREGFIYNSSTSCQYLPLLQDDAGGGNRMLQLPVHFAIDDAMYFSANWAGSPTNAQRLMDPDEVLEMWWSAFWHQYERGGYLNVMLHPFVSGRASRTDMLERLIQRMKGLPGVWFPTCEALARHCLSLPGVTLDQAEGKR